jgi:hypothetical protein
MESLGEMCLLSNDFNKSAKNKHVGERVCSKPGVRKIGFPHADE